MSAEHGTHDHSHGELRRDVSVWGSYMWGFADVGADVFLALGLVMLYCKGATLYAFALAGIVYILIGLAYTELASAYPVAGGGPYFALRGLGDFWGFVAGSALALDYTIDIGLFAMFSAGYFNYFLPKHVVKASMDLGPIHHFQWFSCLETLALIGFITWLNVRGMRESSLLNELIGIFVIAMESVIVILGFIFVWSPDLIARQLRFSLPTFPEFMYGSSLAIISYVGLESISQAAQETRRPSTIVPRTSITLIFTVFIFATAFSGLSLGMLPWQVVAEHKDNPVAILAQHLPVIGHVAGAFTAVIGALILLISSNSGLMSVSRLAYSLSQFNLISRWFNAVHPRYKTPYRTILIFSLIGIVETVAAYLSPDAIDTLANMYAFGATLGYLLVFVSLIKLRFSDPYTPRPYKVPVNFKIRRGGETVLFPALGILGMLGVGFVFFEVVLTHAIGRVAGPTWVLLCLFYFFRFRKTNHLPFVGTVPYDWESQQKEVLTSAEEFMLLEEYQYALRERDKRLSRQG